MERKNLTARAAGGAAEPKPFRVAVAEATLKKIRAKVAAFDWDSHYMPDDGGWDYGANLDYMRELCAYWLDGFDWRAQEARLNRFPQFTATAAGADLHFIHEKGDGPAPLPLLISHGWPGSVAEFLDIIGPLAHPAKFGGRDEDAFEVVAPSLPGFGFSGRPPRPIGPRRMAEIFARLMTETLGCESYLAQGGDWGGAISSWLGYEHTPACRGIHINILTMRHADGPRGAEERAWAARFEREQEMENGYRVLQATRPQTLSYAMADSPVGVAAWMVEKFRAWSDLGGGGADGADGAGGVGGVGGLDSVHGKDALLANIMIYLVTGSFNSASWIYYGRREEGGRVLSPEGGRSGRAERAGRTGGEGVAGGVGGVGGVGRVEAPTGCAIFPAEILSWPPRSYVERLYNVTRWTEMPRGGHFAAMEQPGLLVDDLRAFARPLRRP